MRALITVIPDHSSYPVNCCLPGSRRARWGAGASRAAGLLRRTRTSRTSRARGRTRPRG